MPKESLADGTLEDAIELAYWIYERRRATHKHQESERDAFKCVVRKLINERPLIEQLGMAGPIIKILRADQLNPTSGTMVCLHVSATYDSRTGKTTCNHCHEELYGGAIP